jgi:hypothetical protein
MPGFPGKPGQDTRLPGAFYKAGLLTDTPDVRFPRLLWRSTGALPAYKTSRANPYEAVPSRRTVVERMKPKLEANDAWLPPRLRPYSPPYRPPRHTTAAAPAPSNVPATATAPAPHSPPTTVCEHSEVVSSASGRSVRGTRRNGWKGWVEVNGKFPEPPSLITAVYEQHEVRTTRSGRSFAL